MELWLRGSGPLSQNSPYHSKEPSWDTATTPAPAFIITVHHVDAASNLPSGSLARRVLAESAVLDFFRCTNFPDWKALCEEVPSFAVDLLEAVQVAMGTVHSHTQVCFADPIDQGQEGFGTVHPHKYSGDDSGWGRNYEGCDHACDTWRNHP